MRSEDEFADALATIWRPLVAFVRWRCGTDQAEDIVQDVVLQLCENGRWLEFADRRQLRRYLYKAAISRVVDQVRKRKRRAFEVSFDMDQLVDARQRTNEEICEQAELIALANKSLSVLERTLLGLCFVGGLSNSEAARMLDIPATTIAVNIHRIRQKLRRVLTAPPGEKVNVTPRRRGRPRSLSVLEKCEDVREVLRLSEFLKQTPDGQSTERQLGLGALVFFANGGDWARAAEFFNAHQDVQEFNQLRPLMLERRDAFEDLYAVAVLQDALTKSTYQALRTRAVTRALKRLRNKASGKVVCSQLVQALKSVKPGESPSLRLKRPAAVKKALRLLALLFEANFVHFVPDGPLTSYIAADGPVNRPILQRTLKRQANVAAWKEFHRNDLPMLDD